MSGDCRDLVPGLEFFSCAPKEAGWVRRLKLNIDAILSVLRCLPSLAGDGECKVLLGLSGGDVRPETPTTGSRCSRFLPNVDHSPLAAILEMRLMLSLDCARGEMSADEPEGSSRRSERGSCERSICLTRGRVLLLPSAEGSRVLGVRPRGRVRASVSESRNELGSWRILRSICNCV